MSGTETTWLAVGVIAAVAIALAAWVVWLYRRTNYTLAQFPLFYPFNFVMARILWRAEVTGTLDIPPGQGAVIVCNHIGPIDPSFIALATDRIVHWMVAKEYCVHPAMSWFFNTMQAIPVNRRGVDTAATKLAIRYAAQGDLVGLFPEGRINDTGAVLLPGRPGAALIRAEGPGAGRPLLSARRPERWDEHGRLLPAGQGPPADRKADRYLGVLRPRRG